MATKTTPSAKAKIVGTLGPSSTTVEVISELILAGLNIARVNMSHGTHEAHAQTIKNIREASKQTGREVAILLDLQGPKIRVDKLVEPLILKKGEEWYIGETNKLKNYPEFQSKTIPTIYKKLVADCNVGERVLFDDGLIIGDVIDKNNDLLKVRIKIGGKLKSNKGINLPDTKVTAPSFTEKDRVDLEFGLTQDIDYIALSFVRTARDILDVKEMLHAKGFDIPIVSKIEKPQALDNIDEILNVTDAIMIARGDMAVEVGNHCVPLIQKKLIQKCNHLGIPVITATQMLESMIDHRTPTRAEVTDVANAIWDGTNAVMLSAETASGKYPSDAVKMMDNIIKQAEKKPKERPLLRHMAIETVSGALMVSASSIAEKINAKRIIVITQTGATCLEMMRFRSEISVLGVTNSLKAMRKMCLYWGISPFYIEELKDDNYNFENDLLTKVKKECRLNKGDKIVLAMGENGHPALGRPLSIRVHTIE